MSDLEGGRMIARRLNCHISLIVILLSVLLVGCGVSPSATSVRDLALQGDSLWLCGVQQVYRVNLLDDSIENFPFLCQQLLVTRNGWVWARANHLIAIHDGSGWRELDPPHNSAINFLSETDDGAIWVSSDLLSRRDPRTGDWEVIVPAPGPPDVCVDCVRPTSGYIGPVFEATDGAIWFNEQTQGIVRRSEDSKRLWGLADGLSSPSATAFLQARDESIWIGTATGVNRIYNGVLQAWDFPAKVSTEGSASWVLDMMEDARGRVWVAFRRSGLMVWNGYNWSEVGDFGKDVPRSIFEASSEEIWICCYDDGVLKYDGSGSLIHYPIEIVTFLETPDHRLFGGGLDGLFLYDEYLDQWQPYPGK